jgi:hypothetical protein
MESVIVQSVWRLGFKPVWRTRDSSTTPEYYYLQHVTASKPLEYA